MEKGKWMRYIGYLMIAIIFSGIIAYLFAVLFGGSGSEDLILIMVLFTQNLVIILMLMYMIELIKKVRSTGI